MNAMFSAILLCVRKDCRWVRGLSRADDDALATAEAGVTVIATEEVLICGIAMPEVIEDFGPATGALEAEDPCRLNSDVLDALRGGFIAVRKIAMPRD
ncbi:hypothetical protein LTR85_011661 [Meristemomyces frigidus]|nr:hypothetical protein LTR85_011661 [Meristemomyces frigidus]